MEFDCGAQFVAKVLAKCVVSALHIVSNAQHKSWTILAFQSTESSCGLDEMATLLFEALVRQQAY